MRNVVVILKKNCWCLSERRMTFMGNNINNDIWQMFNIQSESWTLFSRHFIVWRYALCLWLGGDDEKMEPDTTEVTGERR